MLSRGVLIGRAVGAVATWLAALTVLTLIFETSAGDGWTAAALLTTVVTNSSLLLPFAAFAGGLILARPIDLGWTMRLRTAVLLGVVCAAFTYVTYAVGSPLAEYWAAGLRGTPLEVNYPFGPRTPVGTYEHLRFVLDNPSEVLSLNVRRPSEIPPNYLVHGLIEPVIFSIFAILNTVLGLMAGEATREMQRASRRHARWAIGLGSAFTFFAAYVVADEVVRASTTVNPLLLDPLALLAPGAALVILSSVMAHRGSRSRRHWATRDQ